MKGPVSPRKSRTRRVSAISSPIERETHTADRHSSPRPALPVLLHEAEVNQGNQSVGCKRPYHFSNLSAGHCFVAQPAGVMSTSSRPLFCGFLLMLSSHRHHGEIPLTHFRPSSHSVNGANGTPGYVVSRSGPVDHKTSELVFLAGLAFPPLTALTAQRLPTSLLPEYRLQLDSLLC